MKCFGDWWSEGCIDRDYVTDGDPTCPFEVDCWHALKDGAEGAVAIMEETEEKPE